MDSKQFRKGYRLLIKSMKEDAEVTSCGRVTNSSTFVRVKGFTHPYSSVRALKSTEIINRLKDYTKERICGMAKRGVLEKMEKEVDVWIQKYVVDRELKEELI